MGISPLPAPDRPRPWVPAKVQVPPGPARVIDRPRLDAHPAWRVGGLTAITAGPGHGKTLAACQHVADERRRGQPVTWLSIDRYDDHPTRFWPLLVAALQRSLPAVGRGWATSRWMAEDDLSPAELVLGDLHDVERPGVLVLDDVHHLRDGAVVAQLGHLLEHRPPGLRVVMTMRTEPPLPFSWWRRTGRMGELRAADLCFTIEEGDALLRRFPDLALDDRHRRALVTKLDGWPAMVSLTALALRDHHDPTAFVAERLASDRLVMDELVGDVVERLSPDDRRFLHSLSVLDRFDRSLAVEITGDLDAHARLVRLDGDGLFVSALDPERTTFRFHRLVAELLHHELRWRGDDALDDAHRHAAAVLERRGCVEEAMIHLLQAGDPVAALRGRAETDALAPPSEPAPTAPIGDRAATPLSEREVALLRLLPTHLNYREMAAELYVSVNTVKTQIKSVYRKLGAGSRAEAVRAARGRGLLT